MQPRRRAARLATRVWMADRSRRIERAAATATARADLDALDRRVRELADDSRRIHERDAVNLNPATNTMNPRAEALLAAGLGTRPSLGHPGAKYETGLEAIEQIEVLAAELAAEVFDANHVEVRVPSGAMANLFVFMATTRPGDAVIVPPAAVAGHVTHHAAGAAGLYGLRIHEAPIDPARYTVDVDGLAALASRVRPALITVGSSLNLCHHPVERIRAVADAVGALVMFDAAHLSGPIAGGTWPNPLRRGAHVMTMSTYKSLGGPPAGLVVGNDAVLAQQIDAIAFPGLTANFDVGGTAALAVTLLDWLAVGPRYAAAMTANALALAAGLAERGVPVHTTPDGPTRSHAFAVDARGWGGGTATARRLRRAQLLTSAIGLPTGDDAGLRLGTNELTRWGVEPTDMDDLAGLVARGLTGPPGDVAPDVTAWRRRFTEIGYVRSVAPGTPTRRTRGAH